jgi:tetratricopeptide (TPR) repeat protein
MGTVPRVTTTPVAESQFALELEAELDEYPDERGAVLIEAAWFWRRAGEHDRAIELLTEAIALGGRDGGNARVAMAEVLFELDREDEARAQFDVLRRDRPSSPMPYHMAAELLEERTEYQEALTWFNIAVSRLTEQEMADRHGEFRFLSYANHVIAGRRRVRQALELPPDELDESLPLRTSPFTQIGDLAERVAHGAPTPHEVRVLFWPRPEIPRAHDRWPQLVQHADIDTIVRDRELGNRELSEAGISRMTMVPLTVAKLTEFAARTGADPEDGTTRRACLDEIANEGGGISWPPSRNAPCWCGSGAKYKKCCRRLAP